MTLDELRHEVYHANMELSKYHLVKLTWGNVSGIDRKAGVIAIKPSGVEYSKMRPEDIVLVDLDGNVVDGRLKPSSDTMTHCVLYRSFKEIGGVVHTHSTFATAWAQAGSCIPDLGTTHSDHFLGTIPCTRDMDRAEIAGDYEKETGNLIVETFCDADPMNVPAVLVKNHGPFCWGTDAISAVENAIVLEEIARIAYYTLNINGAPTISEDLIRRHFFRKHGKNAYYGQNESPQIVGTTPKSSR